jgi:hypothetical protein
MALDRTKLHRISAGPFNLWGYKTTDAIGTVAGSGYFNNTYDSQTGRGELNLGDVIISVDTDAVTVDVLVVNSADNASTVTTVNGT